ncbi:hypothetical protein FHR81_004212 [Actinoalloteichus hoggarensis]|uniref:Uncharacterized protein n=1 Tax=Actinoalloteichus hoggarensis TaxID=1470176 RepID=A0A221W9N4_9PSEU|nr:hypothetical protein [Actinoalloteichus hoggarensis]ASO22431.1 hypothetical protein AHOG_24125 [Actinoalloteichus hoggarensis]MBB5923145.1 hypothetical protein [Actinoalloteichus hoggarensis]
MSATEKALRHAVLTRLTMLDEAAEREDVDTLAPLARAELRRLTDGWRLLLTVHQPDEDGRCRACPSGWRRRRWPCKVWLLAHRHLIGDGDTHGRRRRPLSRTFARAASRVSASAATGTRNHGAPGQAPGIAEVPGTAVPSAAPGVADAGSRSLMTEAPRHGDHRRLTDGAAPEADTASGSRPAQRPIHRAKVVERTSPLVRRLSPEGP